MSATYTFLASQFHHLGGLTRAHVSLFAWCSCEDELIVVTNMVARFRNMLKLYFLLGFGTM